VRLWATRIGLVGRTTANGHVIAERDHFVALPSKRALNRAGARDYQVQISYRGRTTTAPVWDIGPWNTRDDYWNEDREAFNELPRWMPQAEAAFFQNHNSGRDGSGRWVSYPTSIDLADGTFLDDLGLGDSDWVDVTFLWLNAPSPAARPTPRVVSRPAPTESAPAPVPALVGATTPRTPPVAPSVALPVAPLPVFRAAAYNAPTAATRIYLPLIARNADGWTTEWTIQNTSNAPVDGVIELYDGGGGKEAALPFALAPFASLTTSPGAMSDVPEGFLGSAVVNASRPIAAMVTGERPGWDRYAYEGLTAGAANLFAPLVLKEREGWSTGIQVQNLGTAPTSVQVVYIGSSGGSWVESADLAPLGSTTFYQPANFNLPLGFAGSAVVTSLSGQPVAALVSQARGSGATMVSPAASGGTDRLEAPLLFKRYNGWDSALHLFNLGSNPASAVVSYQGGVQPAWDHTLVPNGGGITLLPNAVGMLPDGYTGSATVQAPPGSLLTGIVSELRSGTMAAMSYSACGIPAAALAIPQLLRAADGWTSGLEIQNPNNVAVPVSLTIYDENGILVQRIQDTIPPGATRNFYLGAIDGIADGFQGSASVQSLSGQPLLAVVNQVGR
jgi:hypothetical protein